MECKTSKSTWAGATVKITLNKPVNKHWFVGKWVIIGNVLCRVINSECDGNKKGIYFTVIPYKFTQKTPHLTEWTKINITKQPK